MVALAGIGLRWGSVGSRRATNNHVTSRHKGSEPLLTHGWATLEPFLHGRRFGVVESVELLESDGRGLVEKTWQKGKYSQKAKHGQANNVSKAGRKYLDYRRRFVQLYLAHEAVAVKWKLHMPDPIVNTGLPPGL